MLHTRAWPCDPSNRVPIPREFEPFKLEREGPSWLLQSDGIVLLRCACGVLLGSPTPHTIAADGTVNASIVCNQPSCGRQPCGWHVFGRLLDWPGLELAAGAAKVLPPEFRGPATAQA